MAFIGKYNLLSIVRGAPPGFYLDGGINGEILQSSRFIPPGAATPAPKKFAYWPAVLVIVKWRSFVCLPSLGFAHK